MEYVGWKSTSVSRRHVGVATSAAAVGVKRSRETAFVEADTLPLSEQFARSYTAFQQASWSQLNPNPLEVKTEVWGITRATRNPWEG